MGIIALFVNIALGFFSYVTTTQRLIHRHYITPADEPSSLESRSLIGSDKSTTNCITCGTDEREDNLLEAPCNQHLVYGARVAITSNTQPTTRVPLPQDAATKLLCYMIMSIMSRLRYHQHTWPRYRESTLSSRSKLSIALPKQI